MLLTVVHINFFKEFFAERTAISLGNDKGYLIESRLAPVARKFGLKSYSELIENIKKNNKEIITDCIDAISTNETFFFRDLKPFRIFESVVLPQIVKNSKEDTIKIWSAACSSGQEPYSLAISMLENAAALKGKKFEILATDLSSKILAKAKEGIYNSFEIQRGLPAPLMIKYFERLKDGNWKVKDEIKKRITFKELNLLDDISNLGSFDCVFCRYVLIYFDDANKRAIVEKIHKNLKLGGALFLGTSETNNILAEKYSQYEEMRSIFFKI